MNVPEHEKAARKVFCKHCLTTVVELENPGEKSGRQGDAGRGGRVCCTDRSKSPCLLLGLVKQIFENDFS